VSEAQRLTRIRCIQNSYSLLDRSVELEVLPLCGSEQIAFTAFSPLAGGWLTGKYRTGEPYPAGSRMTLRPEPYLHLPTERIFQGIAALESAARERGVDITALALAWLLAQPHVTAVVIGPRTSEHLDRALKACDCGVTREDAIQLAACF
jgi:aryl-alcohol dehydrogenase-like predicted oxidoreductase